MQLRLVHAASGDAADAMALADLPPENVKRPLLKRLGQLWELDRSHLGAAQEEVHRLQAEADRNPMLEEQVRKLTQHLGATQEDVHRLQAEADRNPMLEEQVRKLTQHLGATQEDVHRLQAEADRNPMLEEQVRSVRDMNVHLHDQIALSRQRSIVNARLAAESQAQLDQTRGRLPIASRARPGPRSIRQIASRARPGPRSISRASAAG